MILFSIQRPIAVLMICIGLLVLGVISWNRIPLELMPPIEQPEFKVITAVPGVGTTEVEETVTTPLERSFSTIPGILKTESITEKERSEIELKFRPNIDILQTINSIRERIDSAGLPEGVGKSKITRSGAQAGKALLEIAVWPKGNEPITSDFAKKIEVELAKKMERVPGVALVHIKGVPEKKVIIDVDYQKSNTYGITLSEISSQIQSKMKALPVGEVSIKGNSIGVSVTDPSSGYEKLKDSIIKKVGSQVIRLHQVAKISVVEKPNQQPLHLNGVPVLLLNVLKESDANSAMVSDDVRKFMDQLHDENDSSDPEQQFELKILKDEGLLIKTAVQNIQDSVKKGAVLAALCVFLLVQRGWPTFIITIVIPLSLLLSLIGFYFTGISFNLMSLSGLALGLGMLVDSSMIVLESIEEEAHEVTDRVEAALRGTRKVVGAIVASTLATMAVFGPLIFVGGMIGQVFRDVALAVCFCLMASLFVSLTVIPTLSAMNIDGLELFQVFGTKSKKNQFVNQSLSFMDELKGSKNMLSRYWAILKVVCSLLPKFLTLVFQVCFAKALQIGMPYFRKFNQWFGELLSIVSGFLERIHHQLNQHLPFVIEKPKKLYQITGMLTLGALILLYFKGSELFPEDQASGISMVAEFPQNFSSTEIHDRFKSIEDSLRKNPSADSVFVEYSTPNKRAAIFTISPKEGFYESLSKELESELGRYPGLEVIRKKDALLGEKKPLQLEIYHEDLNELDQSAGQALKKIREIASITEIESDIKPWTKEIEIRFKKNKLDFYDLDAGAFIAPLKNLLMGEQAGVTFVKGQDLKIGLQYEEDDSKSTDAKLKLLESVWIPHREGRAYLKNFAEIVPVYNPVVIRHIDRKRTSTIKASLDGIDLSSAVSKIGLVMKKTFPSDLKFQFGGTNAERQESMMKLGGAILFSVLIIFLLLAAQFENLLQPLVVLLAVPLSLCGVVACLYLWGMSINTLVLVGFIILAGSSVNTSIVLVDFANQLKASGHGVKESIIEASLKRLRPIIVTTATNIVDLIPMAFAVGEGAFLQKPIAVTLIGGLISSTVLVMFVVPSAYVWLENRKKVNL